MWYYQKILNIMKNTTFLKFLEFPCSSDCVVSRGKDGFKLDFSKANALDSSYSKKESNTKKKGVISILMLVILFLFSNISTAQITLDGNPGDWGTWLAAPVWRRGGRPGSGGRWLAGEPAVGGCAL